MRVSAPSSSGATVTILSVPSPRLTRSSSSATDGGRNAPGNCAPAREPRDPGPSRFEPSTDEPGHLATAATPSTAARRASGLSETVVATREVVPCPAWNRAIPRTEASTSWRLAQLTWKPPPPWTWTSIKPGAITTSPRWMTGRGHRWHSAPDAAHNPFLDDDEAVLEQFHGSRDLGGAQNKAGHVIVTLVSPGGASGSRPRSRARERASCGRGQRPVSGPGPRGRRRANSGRCP